MLLRCVRVRLVLGCKDSLVLPEYIRVTMQNRHPPRRCSLRLQARAHGVEAHDAVEPEPVHLDAAERADREDPPAKKRKPEVLR